MITHKNMTAMAGNVELHDIRILSSDVYLSFLPLPHILEKLVVIQCIAAGATICFYSGDLRRIKDDLAIVRPTFFVGVPRLFNRFYNLIQESISKKPPFVKFLINLAIKQKLANAKQCGTRNHQFWDK